MTRVRFAYKVLRPDQLAEFKKKLHEMEVAEARRLCEEGPAE